MYLNNYKPIGYSPGASTFKQLFWFFLGDFLFRTHLLPIKAFKVFLLRAFGAQIGTGVVIKPGVKVKFPWRLKVGDHVWIGENVWIDNIAPVIIKDHVCVSQDVYLCTGNHDWRDRNFKLLTGEICIEEGSWIAARSVVGPGVTVGRGAILGLGSVTSRSLKPMTIYSGNPAQPVKQRNLVSDLSHLSEPIRLPVP
ncbi:MAG: colanic acid biosynthesis acetyltransferase WcaF [Snowella sp.]|jgi:putative colanic acid biosynthesis acetyltransferase WcaF|nr:MAG: colanic acid biosynthesis acetyltransferase WcaF [Snowella sp.]